MSWLQAWRPWSGEREVWNGGGAELPPDFAFAWIAKRRRTAKRPTSMSSPEIDSMDWHRLWAWSHSGSAVLVAAALMLVLVGCSRLLRRKPQETHRRGAILADGPAAQRRSARLKRSGAELPPGAR